MLFLFLNLLLDAEFNPLHTPLVNGDEKLRLNTLPNSLLIGYCHFILQNKYHFTISSGYCFSFLALCGALTIYLSFR